MSTLRSATTEAVSEALDEGITDRTLLARVCLSAALTHLLVNPPWIIKAEMLEEHFFAEVSSLMTSIGKPAEEVA